MSAPRHLFIHVARNAAKSLAENVLCHTHNANVTLNESRISCKENVWQGTDLALKL